MSALKYSMRSVLCGVALLGVPALLLAAAPAQAQWHNERIEGICGWIPSTPAETMAASIHELWDEFGDSGFDDEMFCSKLTQNFIKACSAAVRARVNCWRDQTAAVNKQDGIACKEVGSDPNKCVGSYKQDAKDDQEFTKEAGEAALLECETQAAGAYFEDCMVGD